MAERVLQLARRESCRRGRDGDGARRTLSPSVSVCGQALFGCGIAGRDQIYLSIDDDDKIDDPTLEQIVKRRFNFVRVGYSYRATELEAAIALAELERWEEIVEKRRRNATWLTQLLKSSEAHLQLPTIPAGVEHSFMMFPIVTREHVDRDQLLLHLERHGIETRYLFPLLNQPIYQRLFPGLEEQYPVAQHLARQGFFIGIHQGLEEEHLEFMAGTFAEYFRSTSMSGLD